jgi:outer membrane protein TolC
MSTPSAWSVAANLMAPLFNANRLQSQFKTVQEQAKRTYLDYLRSSLIAFQEVENALGQEDSLADREQALITALALSQRTYQGVEEDYRDGNSNILNLMDAQLKQFDIEANLLNVRNARLQNRISLSLALGHGI